MTSRGRAAFLFDPVAPWSLVFFRVSFGAILAWDMLRLLADGWIGKHWQSGRFHFKFFGFGWVPALPEPWMSIELVVLALVATFLALGLWYRGSAILFFLGFSHLFLIEKARYLNHFYLVILFAFLLCWIPANRALALGRVGHQAVPRWSIWLLRTQLGLVYFFAGIAKMNADWLQAQPLKMWLAKREDLPWIGPVLGSGVTPWVFSYGGLMLDLLAWPLLLWRRSRKITFGFLVFFHLTNASIFGIGIFPWLALAATTIFFEPGWPRRWWSRLPTFRVPIPTSGAMRRFTAAAIIVYVAVQILVPLRHFLYPGSVHWTEEGHCFSWHMKLRSKHSRATFLVTHKETGKVWLVDPRGDLTARQVSKMSDRPDMIHQYALHLAQRYRERGLGDVEVRANVECSLNHHEPRPLIDSSVDLASIPRSLAPAAWILPRE